MIILFLLANGAGKTTLISCLTGLLEPTSGSCKFFSNLDLKTDVNLIQQQIGVCLQFDVFYPTLTVLDHLYFCARLKGVNDNMEKHVNRFFTKIFYC